MMGALLAWITNGGKVPQSGHTRPDSPEEHDIRIIPGATITPETK